MTDNEKFGHLIAVVFGLAFLILIIVDPLGVNSWGKGEKVEATKTTLKTTTTTIHKTIPQIPEQDRMILHDAYVAYINSSKMLVSVERELSPIMKRPISSWTPDDDSDHFNLSRKKRRAESEMLDAACRFNPVAEKYSIEQLDACFVPKKLEVPL